MQLTKHQDRLLDDRGLNPFGRLIEKNHLRPAGQAACNREQLLLSATERASAATEERREPREDLEDPLDVFVGAAAGEAHPEIVANAEPGENLASLRHVTQTAAGAGRRRARARA